MSAIVFVAAGAVLPGATGIDEVWEKLRSGRGDFGPPSPKRWNTAPFQGEGPEKLREVVAGTVSDQTLDSIRRARPGRNQYLPGSLLCAGAVDQILEQIPIARLADFSSLGFLLGTMGQDAEVSRCYFYDERERIESLLEGSRPELRAYLDSLRERLPVPAQQSTLSYSFVVSETVGRELSCVNLDSACASSMTALDVARKMILSGELEAALVGGMDSRIGPQNFLSFHALELLSSEGCRPFDKSARGIVPSEGAVVFLITTEARAKTSALPILGYLERIEGGSNGGETSLFAPSAERGTEILRRAWGEATPDYLECHGTGTILGDSIELSALANAFPEKSFPIGSAKAIFGHTLGAAGAVGILKSLLMLRHRLIPGSTYATSPVSTKFLIPQSEVALENRSGLRIGVSSSGFGGSVYHLIVSDVARQEERKCSEEVVAVGFEEKNREEVIRLSQLHDLKIPPTAIPFVDPDQLAAIVVSQGALDRSLIFLDGIAKERVAVISAGHIFPERAEAVARRLGYDELFGAFPELRPELAASKSSFPEINEEISTAIHAAISGRISMFFDLHGKTFHVDAGVDSYEIARRIAGRELGFGDCDVVILFCAVEKIAERVVDSLRLGVGVEILCTKKLALEKGWPVIAGGLE